MSDKDSFLSGLHGSMAPPESSNPDDYWAWRNGRALRADSTSRNPFGGGSTSGSYAGDGEGLGAIANCLLSLAYGFFVYYALGAGVEQFGLQGFWRAVHAVQIPGLAKAEYGFLTPMLFLAVWGWLALQITKRSFILGSALAFLVPTICLVAAWDQLMSDDWFGEGIWLIVGFFGLLYILRLIRARQKVWLEQRAARKSAAKTET